MKVLNDFFFFFWGRTVKMSELQLMDHITRVGALYMIYFAVLLQQNGCSRHYNMSNKTILKKKNVSSTHCTYTDNIRETG